MTGNRVSGKKNRSSIGITISIKDEAKTNGRVNIFDWS